MNEDEGGVQTMITRVKREALCLQMHSTTLLTMTPRCLARKACAKIFAVTVLSAVCAILRPHLHVRIHFICVVFENFPYVPHDKSLNNMLFLFFVVLRAVF